MVDLFVDFIYHLCGKEGMFPQRPNSCFRKEKREKGKKERNEGRGKAGLILSDVIKFTLFMLFFQLHLKADQGLVNCSGI